MKGASAKANAGEMPPLKVVMVYARPDYAECAASSVLDCFYGYRLPSL